MSTALIRPAAVLLDMDGTLTEPLLDFALIRREMGIGERPILEALAAMGELERRAAEAILHRHEEHAAEHASLNAGCRELLAAIERLGIPTGLITRNSRASAATVLRRHRLRLDVLITREDGRFKPDPAPLLEACDRLNVQCHRAWMVGDGQYDVEAAIAAGARAVWLSHGRQRHFPAQPWKTIDNLGQLTRLLEMCLPG
jgi:HAD superfamily hydrolase (TIGR01549 family)